MFMRESRFAADAAHELKTPLASLKIQAQVAQKLENHSDVTDYLGKIIQSVDRANHTVDQLLTLSRTMPDAHMLEHSLVHLDSIITTVISQHYHHTQKRLIFPLKIKHKIGQICLVMKSHCKHFY